MEKLENFVKLNYEDYDGSSTACSRVGGTYHHHSHQNLQGPNGENSKESKFDIKFLEDDSSLEEEDYDFATRLGV